LEHLTTVEENDDGSRNGKQEVIPGLGIWENGVHHVQVIEDGDQQAAAPGVDRAFDRSRGIDDGRNAREQEQPPLDRSAPERQASKEAAQVFQPVF
jgi:hypothetical protein